MAAPGRSRIEWIDCLRGIAILLVVMNHAIITLPGPPSETVALDRINDAVAPFRMPMLMLLSGLLLPLSLAKTRGAYILGKFRAIGWPYLVWTAIIVGYFYVDSRAEGERSAPVGRVLQLIVDPRVYTWYLAYLLGFYLLALLTPARYRLMLIPVLLIICGIVDDNEGWSRLTCLLAFFFMGDWAARSRDRWENVITRRGVIAISAAFAVTTIVLSGFDVPMRYHVWSLPGALGTIVCLIAASSWLLRHVPILAKVGKDSIVYYVTHWPVVVATAHLLAAAGIRNGVIDVLVTMTAGLAVSTGMVWLRRRNRVGAALYSFPNRQKTAQSV